MYNPHQVISHLDANEAKIIALCTVAMLFNYAWFFAALRVARRDRVYSLAPFLTFFWLAGDSSFLWHFDRWFHYYKDWYVELFWVALVFTVLFEIAFTIQLIQYGRKELLPRGTQAQFTALVLAGVAVAIVWWSFIRHVLGDPLWILYFDVANFVGPFFGAGLLLRRQSRAGQTPMIWWCYAAMAACWYVAQWLWFGPAFRSDEYFALGVTCVLGSIAMAYAVSRMPAYERAPEPPAARTRAPQGQSVSVPVASSGASASAT
jgi:hypothetical protein